MGDRGEPYWGMSQDCLSIRDGRSDTSELLSLEKKCLDPHRVSHLLLL